MSPLPAGSYNATLTGAVVKHAKESGKPYVNWEWTIEGGNRLVWSMSMLDFGNTEMTKPKDPKKNPPVQKGKMFKDQFFTLLKTMDVFTEEDLRSGPSLSDIFMTVVDVARVQLVLTVDTVYNNNKVKYVRKYVPTDGSASGIE